jgi:hypothetical protein
VATDEVIEQRLGEAPEDEDVKERLEREHSELLEELRALIPGAQVLFGFLLAIRFTSPFTDLNPVQRYVYYGTLLSTAVALAFTGGLSLITDLVFTTQAAITVALGFFALTGWRWWAIALYRKAREQAAAKQGSADA